MKNLVLTVVAAAVLAQPLPARAQTPGSPVHPDRGTPRPAHLGVRARVPVLRTGEFCAGYDVSTCTDDDAKAFPFGFMVDGVRNWGAFGLVGEVGWYRRDDDSDDPFADRLSTDLVMLRCRGAVYGPLRALLALYADPGRRCSKPIRRHVAGQPFRDTRTRPMAPGQRRSDLYHRRRVGPLSRSAYRRCSWTRRRTSSPAATTFAPCLVFA